LHNLPGLLSLPGAAGVKIFFSESSGNNSCSGRTFIRKVFTAAAEAGKPAAVHTELAGRFTEAVLNSDAAVGDCTGPGGYREQNWLRLHNRTRPPEAAEAGTKLALRLAAETGCRLYLCHLSTEGEFEMVREHKKRYGRESVIAELTPHHLLLDENLAVSGGHQSWAKVNPPLRSPADRTAAALALADGVIDLTGSDHAPHAAAEKAASSPAEFLKCPPGFPGLETLPGAVGGFLMERFPVWEDRLVELTSARASSLFGLADRGAIEPGRRADLVILGGPAVVDSGNFKSKAAYSPFNGMRMALSVYKTILGGKIFEQ
jgi:dihydroorotase